VEMPTLSIIGGISSDLIETAIGFGIKKKCQFYSWNSPCPIVHGHEYIIAQETC